MGTITLKNFRTTADVKINTGLKDGGVPIDWATLTDIKAWIWSDAQKTIAGRCDVSINQEDSTKLICEYASTKPQYPGVNRLIIQATYLGATKTYDKPAFNFVRWTGDQGETELTIDDPEVDVEIEVTDVSSSILDKILAACVKATAEAREVVDVHRGPAAGFGEVDAEADNNVGDPEVEIVTSGDDAAKNFHFKFKRIKGVPGDVGPVPNFRIGDVVTVGADEPAEASIAGTPESPVLNLKVPRGVQGNPGSSVAYPFTLANNRTTNDADKGLTAAEGYRIGIDITGLGNRMSIRAASVDDADYVIRAATSSSSLEDNPSGTRLRCIFQVKAGDLIRISSNYKSGFSCGIWNSPENAVYAGSTGNLQSLVSGYVTEPVAATALYDGYLGVSFSNNNNAISSDMMDVMTSSLRIFVGGDAAKGTEDVRNDMVRMSQFDMAEAPHTEEGGMVYPTGARASHTAWTRYIFKNLGFKRIVARLYTSTSYLAVAFYNSDEWGQASFIGGVVGLDYTQNYDVDVPEGCKTIVVCNRTEDLASPTITLYQDNLKEETIDVYSKVKGVEGGVSDIKALIKALLKDFTIEGKGNTASTVDLFSFVPGKRYRLSIDNPSWAIDGVTIGGSYNCIYIAAYDSTNTRIGNADLYGCRISSYPCPQDIDFTVPAGTKYVRFGIRANEGAVVHFSVTDVTLVSDLVSHVPIGTIEGYGKINLTSKFKEETRQRYINQTLFDTDMYSVGVQSLAIYNDAYAIYGICATDRSNSEIQKCGIVIDDIANRSVLGQFEIETDNTKAHGNNLNLGDKYADDDLLPLVYLSMTYNSKECLVLRIANDFSGYTEIQKITYEGTAHFVEASSYDWIIDGGYIWAYGAYDNNSIEFVKFLKRPTSAQTIGFDDNDVLESFVVNDLKIRQGAFILGGKAYMGLGYSTGAEYIKVVNLTTRGIEAVIPVNYEPEGITIYTGKVCACSSSYHLKTYSDAF